MNRIIKAQLKKCVVADIPDFTDDQEVIYIKKHTVGDFSVQKLHSYLIQVKPGTVCQHNPLDDMDFGANTALNSEYYYICVYEITNKYIKVDATGVDINTDKANGEIKFGVWIPCESLKIIREV